MPVLCLSLHANFVCRRCGACCTAGWPIHVETDRLARWEAALALGRLHASGNGLGRDQPFTVCDDLPPGAGAVLRTQANGSCVLYRHEDGLCSVQRELGHDALPAACQHFPRRCLVERDLVAVSLSHFCPTVARASLRRDIRPAVVEAPASLVSRIPLEGLDASDALPPLLRPGLLADRGTYHAWEKHVLDVLALDLPPELALARIAAFTEELRSWSPADGSLRGRLEALSLARATSAGVGAVFRDHRTEIQNCQFEKPLRPLRMQEAYDTAVASVPAGVPAPSAPDNLDELDATWVEPAWPAFSRPLRNFLATHAFGNWCAYTGRGLRTVVRSLDLALAVLRAEAAKACGNARRPLDENLLVQALRAADLLLVHLLDPVALADKLSAVEH